MALQVLGQEAKPFAAKEELQHRAAFREIDQIRGMIRIDYPTKGGFLDWIFGDDPRTMDPQGFSMIRADGSLEISGDTNISPTYVWYPMADDDPISRLLMKKIRPIILHLEMEVYRDTLKAVTDDSSSPPMWDEPTSCTAYVEVAKPFLEINTHVTIDFPTKRIPSRTLTSHLD